MPGSTRSLWACPTSSRNRVQRRAPRQREDDNTPPERGFGGTPHSAFDRSRCYAAPNSVGESATGPGGCEGEQLAREAAGIARGAGGRVGRSAHAHDQ